jgi:hypothetical protein
MPGIREWIGMSQRERDRLVVIRSVIDGKRSQGEAARVLGLSTRQLRRMQRRVDREKDVGVIHKLRGRPSNNACSVELKERVLSLYRTDYGGDYGPTLFAPRSSWSSTRFSFVLRRCGTGCWRRDCGSGVVGATRTDVAASVARASASCCRWTARTTRGWRTAVRGSCYAR